MCMVIFVGVFSKVYKNDRRVVNIVLEAAVIISNLVDTADKNTMMHTCENNDITLKYFCINHGDQKVFFNLKT